MPAHPWLSSEATWTRKSDALSIQGAGSVSKTNLDLYHFTLKITAKYLQSLLQYPKASITFPYDIRDDSSGYIKLDVMGTMIVVGVSVASPALSRLESVVVRARHLASIQKVANYSFVPIVIFGEDAGCAFYIESPRGFIDPTPYFMRAAHRFLLNRIIPACAKRLGKSIDDYLRVMRDSGEDPGSAIFMEPLIASILADVPGPVAIETVRQIGAELEGKYRQAQ